MSGSVPEEIGPYSITRELGRGGMGVVYLARDSRLDRDVAIKALPEELAEDAERLARFEREARTLAPLNHPNIAGIYGVEEQDGAKYLVLEYVEGETLADMLDRGPLPVDDAIEYAVQIAAGVEAAHEAGVIHRDLKPGNIIITPDGQAKVLDFGLARTEEGRSSSIENAETVRQSSPAQHSPTIEGAILGTAAYMSPEQARGRKVDKRTDIWSFGVVLYEMLVGASPFAGETASDSIGAVLHKQLDLERLPPATPTSIQRVLERCLVRDKNLRFRDIGDVRVELLSREIPIASAAVSPRSNLVPLFAVAAIVFAGLAAAGWLLRDSDHASTSDSSPVAKSLELSIVMPDGLEVEPPIAISPDGSMVAFAASGTLGERHIYLRSLSSNKPTRVADSREGDMPFFSPDGRSLGFYARNALWRVSTNGGPATILRRGVPSVIGATWLEDGTIAYSNGIGSAILRISETGEELDAITDLESTNSYAHVWPQHIPGTRLMLFTQWGAGTDGTTGASIVDLDTGKMRTLGAGGGGRGFVPPVRWSASGHAIIENWEDGLQAVPFDPEADGQINPGDARQLLASVDHMRSTTRSNFALSDEGTMAYVPLERDRSRIVRIRSDGVIEPIISQADISFSASLGASIDITRDGRYAVTGGGSNIVLIDLVRGVPRQLTFNDGNDVFPFFGSDDSMVYFQSNRDNKWKTWVVPLDGSAEPSIAIENERAVWTRSVSDDGTFVIQIEDPDTGDDIWVQTPDGEQRPIVTTRYQDRMPVITPDGSLIAYASDMTGITEIYVVSVTSRARPTQVTTEGGDMPVWVGNGGALMYRRGRAIFRIEMQDGIPVGEPVRVFDAPSLAPRSAAYALETGGQSVLALQEDESAIADEIRVRTNFFDEIERVAGPGSREEDAP